MEPDLDALLAELAAAPPVSVTNLAARRPWQAGDVVLGLTLVSPLGEGGMGRVWRARDASLGRDVAVKELRGVDDPRRVAAFHQEALALGRLAHPHIVQIHRTGAHQGRPVLVMECLVGETLADRLGRGPLPAPEGLRIVRAVLAALDHAHRAGVLHRDLKPANVHLDAAGHVRVLDFGLAHLQGEGPLAAAGTPGFMAPEQRAGGAQDARTDVWAAGALGQAILGEAAPRRARAALAAAMADDPADRPATAGALALRLRSPRRRPLVVGVAAAALVAATTLLALRPPDLTGRWRGADALVVELRCEAAGCAALVERAGDHPWKVAGSLRAEGEHLVGELAGRPGWPRPERRVHLRLTRAVPPTIERLVAEEPGQGGHALYGVALAADP